MSELSLLGGFALSVGGDDAAGVPARAQRLLAFLALRVEVAARDEVARAMWPGSSEERAGANLDAALADLDGPARHAVQVTALDLCLAEAVVVDVRSSRAVARRLLAPDPRLRATDVGVAAVAALGEDLLPGWYDDWALIAAEDWRHLRRQALEAMSVRLAADDRLAEAAAAARAAVRAGPLRESARAALIRVHLAGGNRSAATDELERYRVLLRAELGLEPTPGLQRLVDDHDHR